MNWGYITENEKSAYQWLYDLALKKYINVLDDKEYQIIALRYGLDNNAEHTQKEIGKMYHISRSYVSRIEKRALIKILQEFRKHN